MLQDQRASIKYCSSVVMQVFSRYEYQSSSRSNLISFCDHISSSSYVFSDLVIFVMVTYSTPLCKDYSQIGNGSLHKINVYNLSYAYNTW